MDNTGGSIGTGDAAVLALLADTARAGRGGYGYGMGGEGAYGGCFGPYANASTIQHGIADAKQAGEDQADCTRAVVGAQIISTDKSLENLERNNSFNRICDRLGANEAERGRDNLQLFRELADARAEAAKCCCETQKELLKMQLESQKCCCETQKLIVSDGAATRELINQNTIRAAVDQNNISATVAGINAAAAANTAAIIAAIQANGGHHGPH